MEMSSSIFCSASRKNQLEGASCASFFTTNGLKAFLKSDKGVDGPAELGASPDDGDAGSWGFLKKLAIIDRERFWASCSFLCFSAFSAFFSAFSFSYET
jgi:hypothetical protein